MSLPAMQVKEESQFKGKGSEFVDTKLMTRLTYTLEQMSGKMSISGNQVKFVEEDGIDYAPVTVQLAGGERVPFLFTVKVRPGPARPRARARTAPRLA